MPFKNVLPLGLMISGFARAAQVLDDEGYIKSALQAIEFLRVTAYHPENGLWRTSYFDPSTKKIVIGYDDDVCLKSFS